MKNAYSVLANVYEYLICDCDYDKWSQYVLEKLAQYNDGVSGVDLACGSGFFTRNLAKAGYIVVGVDISQEMLLNAQQVATSQGLNINFLKMDISKLKLFEKVDFATVINDGINYIPQEKLLKTFKTINSNLKKGGIFFFDFSSEYKIKNVLANNMFGEDHENLSYMWFNKLSEKYIDMDLVFFIKNGETYVKKEESHRQYIHDNRLIAQYLVEAGFEILENNEHLGNKLTNQSQRIEYICKKV